MESIYAHTWGFQRCSFRLTGQCEGLHAWNGRQDWLHVFLCLYANFLSSNRQEGAIGKKMIYMKKLFTLRLMLVTLFSVFTLMMKAVIITHSTEDGFTYKLNTDKLTAELVGYSGTAIEIAIPESVTYETVVYGVISLGEKCFYDCSSITSIKIPTSIISLGDWCFSGCRSLKTIQIPSSITTIGRYCFSACSTLNSIDITSPIKTIPEGCFFNCESLSSIVIPSSVETLEGSSFEKCTSLTSLYIPAAVKSLGLSCFSRCI